MLRSLETLKIRMEEQGRNAEKVAAFLNKHPKVTAVHYLGNLTRKDGAQHRIFRKQCTGKGAMLSFEIKGGRDEAFRFLDSLRLIKQEALSLSEARFQWVQGIAMGLCLCLLAYSFAARTRRSPTMTT